MSPYLGVRGIRTTTVAINDEREELHGPSSCREYAARSTKDFQTNRLLAKGSSPFYTVYKEVRKGGMGGSK
jgi:hypothetical protein